MVTVPVRAHQSGCHRWHSCPSDSGSYTCGDTGYCSGCSNNYYCKNGSYNPNWKAKEEAVKKTTPKAPTVTTKPKAAPFVFTGKPKTYTQLYSCKIVGNYSSMIYHLKGSSYIKQMNLNNKECFATETTAKAKGFRKSKN